VWSPHTEHRGHTPTPTTEKHRRQATDRKTIPPNPRGTGRSPGAGGPGKLRVGFWRGDYFLALGEGVQTLEPSWEVGIRTRIRIGGHSSELSRIKAKESRLRVHRRGAAGAAEGIWGVGRGPVDRNLAVDVGTQPEDLHGVTSFTSPFSCTSKIRGSPWNMVPKRSPGVKKRSCSIRSLHFGLIR
jgi:hypothetical protein